MRRFTAVEESKMSMTLILPGYSIANKEWAKEVARRLESKEQTALVHYWEHWAKGGSFRLKSEIDNILAEVGNKELANIIAKSVGTLVAAQVVSRIPEKIGKVILCGIPSVSEERLKVFQKAFKNFHFENVIVFQNKGDPLCSFADVKKFMALVNPNVKVVSKPRSDHNYPYFEDFQEFFENPGS